VTLLCADFLRPHYAHIRIESRLRSNAGSTFDWIAANQATRSKDDDGIVHNDNQPRFSLRLSLPSVS